VDGRSNQIKVFVVCLVTAAFIWLMDAINTGVHTVRINYPIRFVYDDSLYLAPESLPVTVPVNVSGRGWRLLTRYFQSYSASPVPYHVSNPLRATRIDSTQLREVIARQFDGFQVQLDDEGWHDKIKFELKAYKVVSLRVDSVGIDLASGYVLTSYINMSPSLLSVEGPSAAVKQFPDTIIVRIPEKNIHANYESNLPLEIPVSAGIKTSHNTVYVSFEVSQL